MVAPVTAAELGLADKKRERERRRYLANKEAIIARTTAYSKANPEKFREWQSRSRKKHARKREYRRILREYGLSSSQFDEMVLAGNGRCEICRVPYAAGRRRMMNIDHSHKTGQVRGLLCTRCNTAIGLVGEDLSVLRGMAEYLNGCA